MIKEAYVSFEVAKLLKEKGFKESTQFVWYEHLPSTNAVLNSEIGKPKRDYFYWEEVGERNSPWDNDSPVPSYINGEVYSAPTHQMAMKWLREVHHIAINIGWGEIFEEQYQWWSIVLNMDNGNILHENYHASYEEAVEAVLKYVLENLI